ncbi:FGGY-family carbohydrate kinase [Niabella drilacis]|uniref:Sugar (Pentulose or hexulose) kinase n=1 Tax=Niabella drilacis (strain DSM 25811 / CCM 8410 / CCUG 62505 / LMG 26954 / E90) TaxID=1285928 RepID=A0A1G6LUY8_NIADE|nr:FGGY-family carbohydrate kinase [Niabella drilacis]SDC47118.1 Sugar (pentulose or hexulose) kinase [Niabella drilacis]
MLFLGIDMGTSYFKAGLFNREGQLVGSGSVKVPVHNKGVRAELDTARFWHSLRQCIHAAFEEAKADRRTLTAMAYSSQANTFILTDTGGGPLTPLVLWTDERVPDSRSLTIFTAQEQWTETTGIGIPFGAGFCISKAQWFREQAQDLWRRAAALLTLPDYFTFCLTGERMVDTSTASLLGLMDVEKQVWWPEALAVSGIDEGLLSPLCAIGAAGGTLQPGNPLALPSGVPLFAGGLDHHMAAVGVGTGAKAKLSESTGTVIAAVLYSRNPKRLKEVCMAPALEAGAYFKMSFDRNGAAALEWYRETYALPYTMEALLEMAAAVPAGCEGLEALPCAHLYAGKSGFLNQQDRFHHGYYIRAIMESTAISLKQLISKVDTERESNAVFSTGGGAKSALWGVIKESLIGRRFYRNKNNEAACRGAAMVAAAGAGIFTSVFQAQESWLPHE